jgi:branched-chain amino acid aminotransferase
MTVTTDFNISLVEQSKLKDISLKNVPFGKYFTDHMLEVDFKNGQWQTPQIIPYHTLQLDPSSAVLHYGQAIFEGIKAYKDTEGNPQIFRPYDNFCRFNLSAARMQMPQVPEEIFMEGLRKLIEIEKNWIPDLPNHALYIRPFMISSDAAIGVRPSEQYKFMVILSPTGPYYASPMRIYVEEKYVRAVPGGIGFAKAAGNYGAALYPSAEAHKMGFDQVLWMDAVEHKYVQECGTMNIFLIICNKVITPSLEEGTILAGVTRDSVIAILKESGFVVEERPITIDEIVAAHKSGELKEVFGTGTAATIALIKELTYKDYEMKFDVDSWSIAPGITQKMDAINYGLTTDTHGWMYKV